MTAGAILALDRFSKHWIVDGLELASLGRIEVFPPYLTLIMAWNRGINFGIGASGPEAMRWVLVGVAVAISVALVVWIVRWGKVQLALAGGLVVGGALGNAWDRVIYGAVADFLNMSCCGFTNPTSFNVADIAVFIGAFGMVIFSGDSKKAA